MKVVFINCSPKRKFSASAYFLGLLHLFVKGAKITETLRCAKDNERILHQLRDADTVIFSLPLYVDGIPSHVLHFLKDMEQFCKSNNVHLNCYSISNNGFIEGCQSEPLLQVFQNFCKRAGLFWGGGIGIGGGVMLNVTRMLFVVQLSLLLLNMLLSGFQYGNFFPVAAIHDFTVSALVLLLLNMGVLYYILRMGSAINRSVFLGKKYTRILMPSFVFILIANIFFILMSLLQGGIFRGWLAKKKYRTTDRR